MKWKELIVGAIFTLLITIIGGIIVWKYTKEPPKAMPAPEVVYQMDIPASFKSASKNMVFNTIRISNRGDKLAEDIVLSVEFPIKTEISDFSISNSSGLAAKENQIELKSENNEKIISVKSLMPNEIITLSILTSLYEGQPKIVVRYLGGLGEKDTPLKKPIVSQEPKAKIASFISLFLGLFVAGMFYWFKKNLDGGGSRSINNSAFMLLHQGLLIDATKMLEEELYTRGATSFEFVNLGLCKALAGDEETANKFYYVADLYSPSKHIKALIAFNRSISSFEDGDLNNAKRYFEIAVSFDKKRIKKYVKYSIYAQSLVKDINELNEFIPK